ncbi:MAG: XdhC family protein [Oscillospiraceae bacterium]|nr:XdhC family protein [Oscillospiraceae bacterium]
MSTKEFREICRKLEAGQEGRWTVTWEGRRYVRRFAPEERLIVLGGGHIAVPLCAMGAMLGFAVTVVDDRPDFANGSRFPAAAQVICDDFAGAIETLRIRSGDYVCIVTRGHRWDGVCLRALLQGTEPFYLGMIGSRRRVSGMLALLAEEGFDRERLARVHTPIGLPIGGVTVAEIAVSICAQLVQCRRAAPARPEPGQLAQTNTDPALLSFLAEENTPKALALVVDSAGSTPVTRGSLLGVYPVGRTHGTVGGGCGEAEAAAQARRLIGTGARRSITVDMTDDVAAEDGMVCGGRMTLLIEDATL